MSINEILVINIVVGFIFFLLIKRYYRIGKDLNTVPEFEDKISGEIPNEVNATPARALYLYDGDFSYTKDKVFSATILDLCLKGIIEFDVIDSKNINICLKSKYGISNLPEDEKIIYNMLLKAMGDKISISLSEFQKYYKNNIEDFYHTLRSVQDVAEKYERECGNIDLEKEKQTKSFSRKWKIYFVAFFVLLMLQEFVQYHKIEPLGYIMFIIKRYVPTVYIGILSCATICMCNAKNHIISERGNKEISEWRALYLYMYNYSLENEKTSREIKVYERLLVYATVFDVSKRFIKKLQIAHPEIFVPKDDTTYKYWNFVCSDIDGKNGFELIRGKLEKMCNKLIEIHNTVGYSDNN